MMKLGTWWVRVGFSLRNTEILSCLELILVIGAGWSFLGWTGWRELGSWYVLVFSVSGCILVFRIPYGLLWTGILWGIVRCCRGMLGEGLLVLFWGVLVALVAFIHPFPFSYCSIGWGISKPIRLGRVGRLLCCPSSNFRRTLGSLVSRGSLGIGSRGLR